MMKVSICIPTLCNTEARFQALTECIESALGQSWRDLEVVVSDNASALDLPARLAARFPDKRLAVFRNESTIPMPANFNRALSRATGNVLKPLCDDDLLHPGLITGCVPCLEKHPFLRIRDVQFQDRAEIRWAGEYAPALLTRLAWRQKYEIVDAISPTCTLFTREVWEAVGPYHEGVEHVWDYVFAMQAQAAFGFTLSTNIGCAFRVWGESSTASNSDPLRNFYEMHVLYKRNRSFNFWVAKQIYLLRELSRASANPRLLPAIVRTLPNYF
jgi:glycosyltransferase involved in cell wall biosynthesis